MTQKVGDLSVARPGGSLLRALGYTGIIRYAAPGRNDVNITAQEVTDYHAHGLAIGIVNERQADYMLYTNGAESAKGADEVTRAAGLPDGPTFFAADFDATKGGPTHPGSPGDKNMDQIARFLEQAASAVGENAVGFYGSYFACLALVTKTPWLKYYWETEAWSEGMFFWKSDLYQYAGRVDISGVDRDAAIDGYWGSRLAAPKPPTPTPLSVQVLGLPALRLGATGGAVTVLQEAMNAGSHAGLKVDGVFGPATMQAVDNTQRLWHLKVDGIAGPQTDRAISYECRLRGQ